MYLNVDLGEEIKPNLEIEQAIMPYIDACNIACGGHAGNEHTMNESIRLAKRYSVKIGAHPSYPDRLKFGRVSMKMDLEKLRISLISQIYRLQKISLKQNAKIHHVKLHGALYNDAAKRGDLAEMIVKTVKRIDPNYILLAPPKSVLSNIASIHRLITHIEVFGDRNYNDDLSLMNRSFTNALLVNKLDLSMHINSILIDQKIISAYGKPIKVKANTICMHSDHKNAIVNIKTVADWIKKYRK